MCCYCVFREGPGGSNADLADFGSSVGEDSEPLYSELLLRYPASVDSAWNRFVMRYPRSLRAEH